MRYEPAIIAGFFIGGTMNEKQRSIAVKIVELMEYFDPHEFIDPDSEEDALKDFESDFDGTVQSAREYFSDSQEYSERLEEILSDMTLSEFVLKSRAYRSGWMNDDIWTESTDRQHLIISFFKTCRNKDYAIIVGKTHDGREWFITIIHHPESKIVVFERRIYGWHGALKVLKELGLA